jgi:hypothetical protein
MILLYYRALFYLEQLLLDNLILTLFQVLLTVEAHLQVCQRDPCFHHMQALLLPPQ